MADIHFPMQKRLKIVFNTSLSEMLPVRRPNLSKIRWTSTAIRSVGCWFSKRNNLYLNYYISFPQAALGSEVEIPLLEGKAKVKLPAGTQSGQVLRLQGKGLPEVNRRNVGDLIVNVSVWTPKSLSKEEKELLQKLGTSANFAPKPEKKDKSFFSKVRQFFEDR